MTKETVELVDWVGDFITAVHKAKRDDGKINLLDAPKFAQVAFGAVKAFSGIKDIPKELKPFTGQKRVLITEAFKSSLELEGIEDKEEALEKIFEGVILIIEGLKTITDKEESSQLERVSTTM